MNYGLYLSAAGLQAQQVRQNVISNNMANAQTPGFKRDLMVMRARANAAIEDPRMAAYREPILQDQGGGVFASGNGVDLSQAMLEKTGNATDMALDGRGFFTVRGENGAKLLTRDGRFLLNQDGQLVTANGGRAVLDAAGQPITLQPTLPVHVDQSGLITQGNTAAGGGDGLKLGIVDVKDSRQLIKLGGNLMQVKDPTAMAAAGSETRVKQGEIETSGVEPMTEMVALMEGQRAFEANAKMISYQDQTMSQLNTIGRVV